MRNGSNAWLATTLAAAILVGSAGMAMAADKVRLALPTKGYWSSVVADAAKEKGLFDKAGVDAELTIFRSGADAFQALAADAADISLASPTLVAQGQKKGVATKIVGIGSVSPLGWHLVVKADSPIKKVDELAGKKVGMNSAGSASDIMGKWAASQAGIAYDLVPLGGGGVAPNLMAGNIDATVLYAPITYEMIDKGQIRSLVDFSKAMPKSAVDTWAASDKALASNGKAVRSAISALFEAVGVLQKDPDYAISLIARDGDVSKEIAKLVYEQTFMNLPAQNSLDAGLINQYLDFAKSFDPDLPRAEKITASAQ